ncbi:unnamed protein product, partial [Gongylonema pulchrum]|uniref:Uncharacterized protein n=1 Tax=Gongylonema pulchrum TaxID=637853 RepID=A0A183CXB4_9BILA
MNIQIFIFDFKRERFWWRRLLIHFSQLSWLDHCCRCYRRYHFFTCRTFPIASVRKFWPQQRLIFYDIGLNETNLSFIKNLCNVIYRKFNFSAYPEYVRDLYQYRWKVLIIAVSKYIISCVACVCMYIYMYVCMYVCMY